MYRDTGVALLIEHDTVRRAIHVSAGAPGTPTPAGQYEVFRKELRSWSVPFQVCGCVRVPAPEAPGVYDFASIGTAVVVR